MIGVSSDTVLTHDAGRDPARPRPLISTLVPPHHPLKSGPDDPCQLHGAQPEPSRDLRHCRIYTQLTARLKLPCLSEHVVLPFVWAQMEPGASEARAWRMWTAFSHKNSCNWTREPSKPIGRTLRLQGNCVSMLECSVASTRCLSFPAWGPPTCLIAHHSEHKHWVLPRPRGRAGWL